MKKRNFLLVVLLLSSPLTGCLKTSSSEIPHESVLTTEMLRNNAIKEPEIDYGYIESVKEYTALKTASIQSQGFSDQGILVTKNEFNRIGFYSIPLGQQIVHNMFRHESIRDVTVASYQLIAAVIRVYYENMYVFDGYGNLLYNGTNECIVVNEREHEGIIYAQVLVNVREQGGGEVHDEEIYYVYDEFGVASVTDVNIFNYYPNYEPEPIALDDYGLPGYTITYDDEYIVRNASGNEVCRFNMPANTDLMAFFSGKIFYRTKVNVSEGEDYDLIYYNQPIKYTLGTIDLLTGTNTLLNLGYFVDAVYPLRDKDNIFNYCLFTINYVNKKAMGESFEYIADITGKLYDDVTNKGITAYVAVKGCYYHLTTKSIYDNDFKFVKDLSYLTDFSYSATHGYFYGKVNEKYGVINSRGQEVVPFDYDYIVGRSKNDYVIADKGKYSYRINLISGAEENIGANVMRQPQIISVCVFKTNTTLKVHDEESMLYEYTGTGVAYQSTKRYEYRRGLGTQIVVSFNATEDGVNYFYHIAFVQKVATLTSVTAYGSEILAP